MTKADGRKAADGEVLATWAARLLDQTQKDLRFALRSLSASPGFAMVALLVLALGIAVNTAMFSIVNAFLFRPWPVQDPAELASIYSAERSSPRLTSISYSAYEEFRRSNDIFVDLMTWTSRPAPLSVNGQAEIAVGEIVSGNYFSVLGLRPPLGRTLLPEDDRAGAPFVAVISHGLWRRAFSSSPDVLGKTLKWNGLAYTVVGVAPAEFQGFWFPGLQAQLWIPLAGSGPGSEAEILRDRSQRRFLVMGRLKPGISLTQAQAAVDAVGIHLAPAPSDGDREQRYRVLRTNGIRIFFAPEAEWVPAALSAALMAVVGIVLLIAGANITGILLARGISRGKEMAVRLALGASRCRLIRQLLTESVVLSVCGALPALILARLIVSIALAYVPQRLLFAELSLAVPIDVRVFMFTILVCIVTGVLVGLQPALRVSKVNLVSSLAAGSGATPHRARRRLSHWILIPQVCLSLVLLLVAGLFVRTLVKAERIDPGFDPGHTAVLSMDVH